ESLGPHKVSTTAARRRRLRRIQKLHRSRKAENAQLSETARMQLRGSPDSAAGLPVHSKTEHSLCGGSLAGGRVCGSPTPRADLPPPFASGYRRVDRKSTRLNSSHVATSYAVFCLKKKKNDQRNR